MQNPPSAHCSRPQTHAFTLVELLVVIVIIGVLAAIALPVISKVRENGDSTVSVNSMRQLGTALATVQGENNMNLPIGYGLDTTIGGTSNQNFQKRLSVSPSQFGNTIPPVAWLGLFINKTAAKKEKFATSVSPYQGSTPYGINSVIDADVKNGPGLYGDKTGGTWNALKIPNASGTVILGDTFINPAYFAVSSGGSSADANFDYKKAENSPFALSYRHPGKRTALMFADWHIITANKAEVTEHSTKPRSWFDPADQQ